MTDLELIHIQMFTKEGDPGWHAGQLDDGRRVHAAAVPCNPGELHWSGSVEDPDACECHGAGTCNPCLIRADGGLVFTRVTGCYRSANSAVRTLQHWAAHPECPQPPAPFNCRWTTMQAILCDSELDAPPMPLDTTEHPITRPRHADQQPEHDSEDLSQFEYEYDDDPYSDWKYLLIEQIKAESLEECSKSGHPRQAWLILSEKQEQATVCPICGKTPEFWDQSICDDRIGFDDYLSETISETHMATHEIFADEDDDDDDPDNVTFIFDTRVFRSAEDWPEKGSNDLTRLPYPGDDAITLEWFREEWAQRGYLPADAVLLHPDTKEPLTDETLREIVAEGHEDGFCYETTAIDVIRSVTKEMRRDLKTRDGKICQHCQEPVRKHDTVIERKDPAQGDGPENLHLLCQRCHRVKKDVPWEQFRKDWEQRFGFQHVKRVVQALHGTDDEQMDEVRLAYRGNAERCTSCWWILVGDYALNEDRHCAYCVVGAPRRLEFQFPPRE